MKKGAFQLSLGLLVVVIFAVVLLSFAIMWLRDMIPGLQEITHQVTDVAKDKMIDELSSSNSRVGIAAPKATEWKRGESGTFSIGIRNIYTDKDKKFHINVYLEKFNSGTGLKDCGTRDCPDVSGWLTFSDKEFIEAGKSGTTDLTISPPADADAGIYLFRTVVCENKPCRDIDSSSLYGSDQFTLEIKAA